MKRSSPKFKSDSKPRESSSPVETLFPDHLVLGFISYFTQTPLEPGTVTDRPIMTFITLRSLTDRASATLHYH